MGDRPKCQHQSGCDQNASESFTLSTGAPLAQGDIRWGTIADTRRQVVVRLCTRHYRELVKTVVGA